jgi:putative membrane protein
MKTQNMIKLLAITGLVVGLGAPLTWGAETRAELRGQLNSKDYKFLSAASQSGQLEVQLGELAKQNGGSQAVRDFGERMVNDHTKANNDLKQIAAAKQATPETQMTSKEDSRVTRLQKLTGVDFDKAYLSDMIKDHKKDVKEFENASTDASDPDVKAFAEKTLPTVQQHLRQAQDMLEQIKK